MSTLVLNANCTPISVFPISTFTWEEAVKTIWLDRSDVLAEYEDWEVHSPSISFKVPSVIMLREYVKTARTIRFSRENILLRDEYTCQYCGADYQHKHDGLTYDHVVPRAKGGKTNWTNIVAACQSCNLEKSHHDRMKPNTTPKKPSYFELVNKRQQFPIEIPDITWNEFLGWDPALVIVRKPNKN